MSQIFIKNLDRYGTAMYWLFSSRLFVPTLLPSNKRPRTMYDRGPQFCVSFIATNKQQVLQMVAKCQCGDNRLQNMQGRVRDQADRVVKRTNRKRWLDKWQNTMQWMDSSNRTFILFSDNLSLLLNCAPAPISNRSTVLLLVIDLGSVSSVQRLMSHWFSLILDVWD